MKIKLLIVSLIFGGLLRAQTDPLGAPGAVVRRDARTGRVLATALIDGAGPGNVLVSGQDIWVDYPAGMSNNMRHLQAPDLRDGPIGAPAGDTAGVGQGRFSQQLVDDTLWTFGDGTPHPAACIDPHSGALRHAMTITANDFATVLVGVGHDVLYVVDISGVTQIPIPPACRAH